MKTKFIYLEIKVKCGEYDFTSNSVHQIPSSINVDEFADDYAKDFYQNHSHSEDDVHYFNGGEVSARAGICKEITKEQYEFLNRLL